MPQARKRSLPSVNPRKQESSTFTASDIFHFKPSAINSLWQLESPLEHSGVEHGSTLTVRNGLSFLAERCFSLQVQNRECTAEPRELWPVHPIGPRHAVLLKRVKQYQRSGRGGEYSHVPRSTIAVHGWSVVRDIWFRLWRWGRGRSVGDLRCQ